MGNLAFWGGVAGAGKGVVANAENQQRVDMQKLEADREMRLRQYEAEQAQKRQTESIGAQKEMQGAGFAHEDTSQEKAQTFSGAQAEKEQTFKAGEGAKDRASAERIAGMRVTAAAGARGKGRWQKSMMPASFGANGQPIDPKVTITDQKTGSTYIQQGDKFVTQGNTVKMSADPKAVSDLLANPDLASEFIRKYGYLPMEFIGKLGEVAGPADNTAAE